MLKKRGRFGLECLEKPRDRALKSRETAPVPAIRGQIYCRPAARHKQTVKFYFNNLKLPYLLWKGRKSIPVCAHLSCEAGAGVMNGRKCGQPIGHTAHLPDIITHIGDLITWSLA